MCFLVLFIYLNQNILITDQKQDYELSGIYIAEPIKRWIEEQRTIKIMVYYETDFA